MAIVLPSGEVLANPANCSNLSCAGTDPSSRPVAVITQLQLAQSKNRESIANT